MSTLTTLENRILVLEKKVTDLTTSLEAHKTFAVDRFQTISAAATARTALEDSITALTTTVEQHTAKFVKVQLPEETQYYLKQSDITGLKRIVAQAAALRADVDKQMKALIAAWQAFRVGQNI